MPKRIPATGWTVNLAKPGGVAWLIAFFGLFWLIGFLVGLAL